MKLLHPEVDVTPGRAGKRPQSTPYQDREKLDGSVILRLTNDTTQENAYTVRLRCDNSFWQEGWYTVQSLPAAPGAPTTAVKPDVSGPQGRSVKVFVPRSGSRDILIRFSVPAKPESRAGRYDYAIEVETQVTAPQAGDGAARRKDRLTSLPAAANVRPFYKWGLDLTPDQRRVGRRRRTGEFDVVVTNEGNDWLYCDLQLPRPKDLLLDCPTLRLAVPPPEPGELLPSTGLSEGRPGTQRTVPLVATTRLKTFRGDLTPQPLMLSALRVDAPSLPPPPEDGFLSLGSVVATEPTPPDTKPAPADRALVYAPPVPAKLLDFFSRSAGSVRAWIAPLLALMIMVPLAYVAIQHVFFSPQMKKGYTFGTTNLAEGGKPLYVSGKLVVGSHYTLTDQAGTVLDEGTIKLDARNKAHPDPSKGVIAIPKKVNNVRAILTVQRLSFLPLLSAVLPKDKQVVEIGTITGPVVASVPEPLDGQFKPGQQVQVKVVGFNGAGTILLDGVAHKAVGWTQDHVTLRVPEGAPGKQFVVALMPEGATQAIPAGSITLATAPSVTTPGAGTTAGAGTTPGAGAGGKSGGGGAGGGKVAGGAAAGGKTAGKPAGKPAGTGGGPQTAKNVPGVTPGNTHNPPPPYQPPAAPAVTAEDYILQGKYDTAISAVGSQDTAYAHAVKAIAYARNGNVTQASSEAALADGKPQTPAEKSLALLAHGWISLQQKNRPLARTSFKQAVGADPSPLAKVSDAWGQPDINKVTDQLHTLLNEPGMTPAAKQGVDFQYHAAYKKETEE